VVVSLIKIGLEFDPATRRCRLSSVLETAPGLRERASHGVTLAALACGIEVVAQAVDQEDPQRIHVATAVPGFPGGTRGA
jgi:hypothetical protein